MTPTLLLSFALAQADAGAAKNLLTGLAPKAEKVANVERMTDGKAADPGDSWQTVLTSVIEKDGHVTWDLGSTREWEGAWIQADNNDVYILSTSDDGEHFTIAWESSTIDNAGMQTRTSTTARGRGRFLKLTARGGDSLFSVGEIAVFASGPEAKAFTPSYVRTGPEPQPVDGNWLVIAVVLAGLASLVKWMKQPREAAAAAEAPKDEKKEAPPAAKT